MNIEDWRLKFERLIFRDLMKERGGNMICWWRCCLCDSACVEMHLMQLIQLMQFDVIRCSFLPSHVVMDCSGNFSFSDFKREGCLKCPFSHLNKFGHNLGKECEWIISLYVVVYVLEHVLYHWIAIWYPHGITNGQTKINITFIWSQSQIIRVNIHTKVHTR